MSRAFDPSGPPDAYLPRDYQQVLRGPSYRWWRPAASLALLVLGAVVGYVSWAMLVLATIKGVPQVQEASTRTGAHSDAFNLLTTNLLLALLIPITMLATWGAYAWRPGWLWSVAGHARGRWLVTCLLIAVVVEVAGTAVAYALSDGPAAGRGRDIGLLLGIVLLTTPLQAAGEEFFFRGWLPQQIGSLIRHRGAALATGAVVSSALFAVAHGTQTPWLFIDRFGFGLISWILVWRTGGLEASVAMHAVNNIVVFVPVILSGRVNETLYISTAAFSDVMIDLAILAAYAGLVLVVFARSGRSRMLIPPSGWTA